jgi:hypothetical protein
LAARAKFLASAVRLFLLFFRLYQRRQRGSCPHINFDHADNPYPHCPWPPVDVPQPLTLVPDSLTLDAKEKKPCSKNFP